MSRIKAMIFAAGRGERMRPLTDTCPKPLLKVGGKALIEWQIEALVEAGFTDIVINHAWLGEHFETVLGDGRRFGATLHYSAEHQALETAGGIRHALPLLYPDRRASPIFLAIAGDIFTRYDYHTLRAQADKMQQTETPGMHLVMVPNPPFHPTGDFSLDAHGRLSLNGPHRLTFGSIALYDIRLFKTLPPHTKVALTPYYHAVISAGHATGEYFAGEWENIGTPEQLTMLDTQLQRTLSPRLQPLTR